MRLGGICWNPCFGISFLPRPVLNDRWNSPVQSTARFGRNFRQSLVDVQFPEDRICIEPGNRLPWWPRKWWIFKWFEVPLFAELFWNGWLNHQQPFVCMRQVLAIQTKMSLEMDRFQFEKGRELCVFFEESPCWWNGLKKMLSGP